MPFRAFHRAQFSFYRANLDNLAIGSAEAERTIGTISAPRLRQNSREEIAMRQIIFAIVMLVLAGMNTACNTVRGLGQDVEHAGEKTQDAAENVKRRL